MISTILVVYIYLLHLPTKIIRLTIITHRQIMIVKVMTMILDAPRTNTKMTNTTTTPKIIIVLTTIINIPPVATKMIETVAIIVIVNVTTTTIIIHPVASQKLVIIIHLPLNETLIVALIVRRILIVEPSNLLIVKSPPKNLTNQRTHHQRIHPISKLTLLFRINFLKLCNCPLNSTINFNQSSIHQCLSPCQLPILSVIHKQILKYPSTLFHRQLNNLFQSMVRLLQLHKCLLLNKSSPNSICQL